MRNLVIVLLGMIQGAALAWADAPSVHGMFVFGGEKATYISHLPMFHAPHDYQAIFKVAFGDLPRSETLRHYELAQSQGAKFFTLEPEVMDLTEVMNGNRTTFIAMLYQGHFERGGERLGWVKVKVDKIVLAKRLDATLPQVSMGSYFVFGEKGEYFAAHLIGGKPSFDAILLVSAPFFVHSSNCRGRICREPIQVGIPDADLPLTLTGPSTLAGLKALQPLGVSSQGVVDVLGLLYAEEGDLSH